MGSQGVLVSLASRRGKVYQEYPDVTETSILRWKEPLVSISPNENIAVAVQLEANFRLHGARGLEVIIACGYMEHVVQSFYLDEEYLPDEDFDDGKNFKIDFDAFELWGTDERRAFSSEISVPAPVGMLAGVLPSYQSRLTLVPVGLTPSRRLGLRFRDTYNAAEGCIKVTVTRGSLIHSPQCVSDPLIKANPTTPPKREW